MESKIQVTLRMDGFGWGSPTANLLEITWSPGQPEPGTSSAVTAALPRGGSGRNLMP